MSAQDDFVALLDAQPLSKGDVIFVLQGDGLFRAPYAAELFKKGYAPLVGIVGNDTRREYGSFPSTEVREELLKRGVPATAVYLEEVAPHTKAEAKRAMELAREKSWKTMLILTSPHHHCRAFLTFLKAMRDARMELSLVNAVAPLSMDESTPWGTRRELLAREFDKIEEYRKQGDVASFEEGIAYLKSP